MIVLGKSLELYPKGYKPRAQREKARRWLGINLILSSGGLINTPEVRKKQSRSLATLNERLKSGSGSDGSYRINFKWRV